MGNIKFHKTVVIGAFRIMRVFQGWLTAFIIFIFATMFGISWKVYSHISKSAANDMLRLQLRYACEQIDHTQKNLEAVTQYSHGNALIKAHTLARIIEADPSIVKKKDELEKLRKMLAADEIHISNGRGILIASQPDNKLYIDYDMNSKSQSKVFMPALTNKNFELVQQLQPSGAKGDYRQYVGVARQDKSGIIQIAYTSERIREAQKTADVNTIAKGFRIGRNGTLTIRRAGDTFLKPGQELFQTKKDDRGVDCTMLTIFHNGYLLTGTLPNLEIYLPRDSVIRVLIVANILFFVVIFVMISILLQRIVISRIHKINTSLAMITGGDLNEQVRVGGSKEFEELSGGINTMVSALKNSIEREKNRIRSELELGHSIQLSVLPGTALETPNIRLSAGMFTASEVGGDFYDFFRLDSDRLAIVIADVCGKGLPAALGMMNAKTLLKEQLLSGSDLQFAVEKANREFCRNNKEQLFLTAFVAVIDVKKQTISFVNAGHNPPLVKYSGQPWKYLALSPAVPLAVREEYPYKSTELPFQPGDRIFLYTDGVTEARNTERELFGMPRLLDTLNEDKGTPADDLDAVKTKVDAFANGVPQSDDITMLACEFKKP